MLDAGNCSRMDDKLAVAGWVVPGGLQFGTVGWLELALGSIVNLFDTLIECDA